MGSCKEVLNDPVWLYMALLALRSEGSFVLGDCRMVIRDGRVLVVDGSGLRDVTSFFAWQLRRFFPNL